jgi:two-component system response regulator FixJ
MVCAKPRSSGTARAKIAVGRLGIVQEPSIVRIASASGARNGRHQQVNESAGEIFIVDDDPDMCKALTIVFARAGYRATTFTDGAAFVRAARERTPTCVLLDLCMPGLSGLEILTQLGAENYAAPIVMLSARSDIPDVVEAIRNGAFDFIEKQLDAAAIIARVRQAIESWTRDRQNGERRVTSSLSFPGCDLLTPREHDVLSQIAAAASNKETARNLGISPRTVAIHRGHIMKKLSAKNSVELTRIVLNKVRAM